MRIAPRPRASTSSPLGRVVAANRARGLGAGSASGEPGALQVDPDRRRAREAAARHELREDAHPAGQIGAAPGDRRGQERRGSMTRELRG